MPKLIILIAFLLSTPILAQDIKWNNLEGTYALTGAELIDPSSEALSNTHIRFSLTGKSAADLYHHIEKESSIDLCTGAISKSIGQMQCLFFESDDTYQCHFSINLPSQKIEYGLAC